MKRKRGHKKKKSKAPKVLSPKELSMPKHVSSPDSEDNSDADEVEHEEQDTGMEVDTASSSGAEAALNLVNINPDGSVDKSIEKPMGRVKVKLKPSKILESHHISSDAPAHSDMDRSSQQMGMERQGTVVEKTEDSANSLLRAKPAFPIQFSRKAGSIKIKNLRPLVSSNDQTDNIVMGGSDNLPQQEVKVPRPNFKTNKEELDSALVVIKKVMKMDAAEPFNVPVDPVALGIPDYFDIIDTPMDFGTICSNLEKGVRYLNSEDVFKDVQYIWDNCFKYNSKGDYILDLMRRVKKNFMKYWTAAGLYTNDISQAEDAVLPTQGKAPSKTKGKKRHGRRHKNDCLCAICVLKRRRKEREDRERIARGLIGVSEETKQEESFIESHGGEGSSSDADDSLDQDADAEMEDKEGAKNALQQHQKACDEKDENGEDQRAKNETFQDNMTNQIKGQVPLGDGFGGEPARKEIKIALSGDARDSTSKEHIAQQDEETERQQPIQQDEVMQCNVQLHKNFIENPMLLELCGTLFPEKVKNSIWSGPHSLVPRKHCSRGPSIRSAMESLME